MEKLYRVQMNKNGMPNFSTAEEVEPCEDDLIRRSDAIKAMAKRLAWEWEWELEADINDRVAEWLGIVPAVEPWDLYDCDEWCTDCKEYDAENHRCPRWNRVIRRTVEENKVVNCCGCVHWVNDVAIPDRMICKELKIPTEDFFFCGWGEREGSGDE